MQLRNRPSGDDENNKVIEMKETLPTAVVVTQMFVLI